MSEIIQSVRSLRTGDTFRSDDKLVWTAESDALTEDGVTRLLVRYPDGGTGQRAWDDPDWQLAVERDES